MLVYSQETVFKTFLSFSFSKPMGERYRYPMAEYSFFLLYTSFNASSVLRLLSRFHPLHLSMSGIAFTRPVFGYRLPEPLIVSTFRGAPIIPPFLSPFSHSRPSNSADSLILTKISLLTASTGLLPSIKKILLSSSANL